MEENNKTPPTSLFFSMRAKFMPKKTPEELQAASELVKKLQEENSEKLNIERAVLPDKKGRTKGKKNVKSQSSENKNGTTGDLCSIHTVALSASAKKRLKKLHDEQQLELECIEAENQRILDAVDENSKYSIEPLKEITEDFEKITVLNINYMSKISRLKCYENDKFLDIFPKVAELFNLRVTEFLLCYKEGNITVDDTPKSLKLASQDTLECIPYKADENSKTETENNGNSFKIMFQSNDTKRKIDMLVHKIEKMHDIMNRYSQQRDIPLNNLIFNFDGERLSGDETPMQLDMEAESCIDVTVLIPTLKVTEKNRTKQCSSKKSAS